MIRCHVVWVHPKTLVSYGCLSKREVSSKWLMGIHFVTFNEFWQVVLPSGKAVADLQLQIDEIRRCPGRGGVIVTGHAPSESGLDFISRYFCPKFGINEVMCCHLFLNLS